MKLTIEQLRASAHGVVAVFEQKDGVHFERFTEEERAVYADNPGHITKTHATAGVRLEFTTDSQTLSLTTKVSPGCSRLWFSFEVFANGRLVGELGNENTEEFGKFSKSFQLGNGVKRVCVYFPWSASAVIRSVTLDKGSAFIPVRHTKRMLMFGDSLTQGYDARYPSSTYATGLADALCMDVCNKGIGGDVFRPALAAADCGITPDIITVAYGTNDWAGGNREVFERDCLAFYRTLSEKYPYAKIFAFTPIWRADLQYAEGWTFEEMSAYIRAVAEKLPNVVVVDGLQLVPHDTIYFEDGFLHPTDEGFQLYLKNAFARMVQHLE